MCVGDFVKIDVKDVKIPMSLFCRSSLKQHLEKLVEFITECTQKSIEFYNKLFDYKYPFDKMDHVFCPEYNSLAMENVGMITYNDC